MSSVQLPSGELQVSRQTYRAVTVLTLAGELDLATVPVLVEALDAIDGGRVVVLDLGELTFIDSQGLRAIFARAGTNDLILAQPSASVARLLALTKGDRLVRIADSREAALEAANDASADQHA